MNSQKSFKKIALIVLVAVLVGVVGYLAFNSNNGKITYSGEWTQAQFPKNNYHHSVNIMLPSTWKFNCCGDTDSFSAHSIYPVSSESNIETSPHITVYDFVLSGCLNGGYTGCSIDKLQKVTPTQYMTSLVNHLEKNGEVAGLESLKKTGTVKLESFTSNAIVYSGFTRSNQPVDLYVIQSSKGVVGVSFQQPKSFEPNLKTKFLNSLIPNIPTLKDNDSIVTLTDKDPLLEKYGQYAYDTFKKYPDVLASLKKIDPEFTDLDMNVSSPSKVATFKDGRKMILMQGCFPHACGGSEKVVLYDPVNQEIYLQTNEKIYSSKSDMIVEKFLSDYYTGKYNKQKTSKAYSNTKGGYVINYPGDATLSFSDRSSNPERCVVIKYGLGFIDINNGASDPCTITGTGAYDKRVTDKITLSDGAEITAIGFLSPENTSFASFELNPDVYVTYGVSSNTALNENDYQQSLADIKSIISTLRLVK